MGTYLMRQKRASRPTFGFKVPSLRADPSRKQCQVGKFGCIATNGHSGIGGWWCLTPSAPYEKSKFWGSGGSMVTRLKL